MTRKCESCIHYRPCSMWNFEERLTVTSCPFYAEAKTETGIFDQVERVENVTVEILTNTVTGETSIGWYRNKGEC